MSITDELRKWGYGFCGSSYEVVNAIADRIDAEHEEAIQQVLMDDGGVPATDENMAEHGWVRLPVDADGEYIHIGDVMEGERISGGYGEPFEVIGYVMSNGELEPMDEHRNPRKRKYLRHHHAPTVEDVMVEFATDWESAQDGEDKTAVLEEYASKLQLREDA